MTKHNLMYRPGLCAIAAFVALGSTPLLAQSADPVAPAETAPIVTSTPIVATPDPVAVPTADPLAPSTATTTAKAKPSAIKVSRSATRTTTTRTVTRTPARPAAVARAAAPIAAAPAIASTPAPAPVEAAPLPTMAPAPLPAETPVATAPTPAPVADNGLPADALPIGAAGLGLVALAGAALAMRRRKRRLAEDEFESAYDEPAFAAEAPVVAEPVAAPVMADPASFAADRPVMAWAAPAATVAPTVAPASVDGDGEVPDNVDPASHVAAAYRGPTAENPSLSLKTRLKRAAFFDQRERQAAAGEAAPLDMTAGLPDAIVDETSDSPSVAALVAPAPTSTGGSFTMRPTLQSA